MMASTAAPRDWGAWQAAYWARAGRVHPDSVSVMAAVDPTVGALLYWNARDLDASADLDDVIQMIALAQLEAQATTEAPDADTLRTEAQRRMRRWTWHIRQTRGRDHRAEWEPWVLDAHADSTAVDDIEEELLFNELVATLGAADAALLWTHVVDGHSLTALGWVLGLTKQQVWRRVQRGLRLMRAPLTA